MPHVPRRNASPWTESQAANFCGNDACGWLVANAPRDRPSRGVRNTRAILRISRTPDRQRVIAYLALDLRDRGILGGQC